MLWGAEPRLIRASPLRGVATQETDTNHTYLVDHPNPTKKNNMVSHIIFSFSLMHTYVQVN